MKIFIAVLFVVIFGLAGVAIAGGEDTSIPEPQPLESFKPSTVDALKMLIAQKDMEIASQRAALNIFYNMTGCKIVGSSVVCPRSEKEKVK